jgi:hypothetical protein
MSRVHAIRTLEQLADSEVAKPSNATTPGIVLKVIHVDQAPQPAPIDVTPRPQIIDSDT